MRRTLVLTTTLLLTALGVAGCSSAVPSMTLSSGFDGMDAPARSSAQAESMVDAGGNEMDSIAKDEQIFIVNGYLSLTVEEPVDAATEVSQIVEKAGGRVDARTEYAPQGKDRGSAQMTVRIPSDRLSQTLESLKELGKVEQIEQTQSNVTAESQDLDARISALRTSVDRLLALMAEADSTADLITIESALSERQANLESMESQKRSLDDQVSLSTFSIYLGSEADAPTENPDTFLSGIITGWDAFVGFFAFLLVALGVLVPWVALAGLITIVVVVLVRRRIKKRKSADPAP